MIYVELAGPIQFVGLIPDVIAYLYPATIVLWSAQYQEYSWGKGAAVT
jgi:hypothetical protein